MDGFIHKNYNISEKKQERLMNRKLENFIKHSYSHEFIGKLEGIDVKKYEYRSEVCSDYIILYIEYDNIRNIVRAKFDGKSCSYSRASCSLVLSNINNKSLEYLKKIDSNIISENFGDNILIAKKECCCAIFELIDMFINSKNE